MAVGWCATCHSNKSFQQQRFLHLWHGYVATWATSCSVKATSSFKGKLLHYAMGCDWQVTELREMSFASIQTSWASSLLPWWCWEIMRTHWADIQTARGATREVQRIHTVTCLYSSFLVDAIGSHCGFKDLPIYCRQKTQLQSKGSSPGRFPNTLKHTHIWQHQVLHTNLHTWTALEECLAFIPRQSQVYPPPPL